MDKSTQWLLVLAIGLTIIYIMARRRKKRDPLMPDVHAPRPTLAAQRQVEQQMQNLLVDFAEMARQMSGQLDTRAAKLELLLKEADEKLAALQSSLDARRDAPMALDATRESFSVDSRPSLTGSPTISGLRIAGASDTVLPGPALAPTAESRHSQIYTLADQGQSPNQIARQLNRPSGEIELILALRRE